MLKPTNIFVKYWNLLKINDYSKIFLCFCFYFVYGTPCPAPPALAWFPTVLCRIFRCRGPKKFVNNLWLSVFTRYSFRNPLWLPFRRIKEKAPYKMNQDGYCYPFSIQFRTVLGGFSVLTDPAPLARLEIVFQYSVFRRKIIYNSSRQHDCNCTFSKKQGLCFSFRP